MRALHGISRAIAPIALAIAALVVSGCAGGGGSSLPKVPVTPAKSAPKLNATANFRIVIPSHTTTQSGTRNAKYIQTTAPNSAIVVTVSPADPAEQAQFATLFGSGVTQFSVCYNLYTNGAVNTTNPGVTVAPFVGPPAGTLVTFPLPAPPGNDTYVISQYAGQCIDNFTPPTPAPNAPGASAVLAVSNPVTVYIQPGQANNVNVNLTVCPVAAQPNGPCSNVVAPGGTPGTPIQLAASVASIYLGGATPVPAGLATAVPLPIPVPIHEQGVFLGAASQIGVPIPLVGLDAAGFPIAGNAAIGAGPVAPITLTRTETNPVAGSHTKMQIVDAANGAIAQTESGTSTLTVTQFNALAAADITFGGSTAVAGDPYVIVLTYDGSAGTQYGSTTISASAVLKAGAAATTSSTTIAAQSAIYSAGGTGYADLGGPYTAASGIATVTAAGPINSYFVTDGGNVAKVGVGRVGVGGTALTGITYNSNINTTTSALYVVDNAQVAGGPSLAPINSGIYALNAALGGVAPVALQAGGNTGSFTAIGAPQGITYSNKDQSMYVVSGGGLYSVDIQGTGGAGNPAATQGIFQLGSLYNVCPAGTFGTTTSKIIGMTTDGSGNVIIADPTNKKIVSLAPVNSSTIPSCTLTTVASGQSFVGVSYVGTTLYATTTTGQVYSIATNGATPVSLGLNVAATAADGASGVFGTLPLAANQTLTAKPYAVQGQAANFFGSASVPSSPYNLAPFTATGPIFAPAGQTAVAGAPLNLKADTSSATISATAGAAVVSPTSIVFVKSGTYGANTALTPDSFLFTDNGVLRTIIP